MGGRGGGCTVLTVNKRVHEVGVFLSYALIISTAAALKIVSDTAHPRLRCGALGERVLHAIPAKRFSGHGP